MERDFLVCFISGLGQELVEKWNEAARSDSTTGILRENLPKFFEIVKKSGDFPKKLSYQFTKTLEQLANDCDTRGLTSTVHGELDEKTSMFCLFHCVEAEDGTVTVSYTVHTLSAELAREGLNQLPDDGKLGAGWSQNYLVRSAIEDLQQIGVHPNLQETSALHPTTVLPLLAPQAILALPLEKEQPNDHEKESIGDDTTMLRHEDENQEVENVQPRSNRKKNIIVLCCVVLIFSVAITVAIVLQNVALPEGSITNNITFSPRGGG